MIGVLIIPTGIGCEIGGHAGDANPVAKLLAGCCDKLITHPNVVNASDINEMTENTLYVDGAMLDKFLEDSIYLEEVKTQNKILVVVNGPVRGDTVNAVSTARVTIGIDAEILELDTPLRMVAHMEDGKANGNVNGCQELIDKVIDRDFDALAIHTPIEVPKEVALKYYREGGVNPWGGIEAIVSRRISSEIHKPVAHAPLESVTHEDGELFEVGFEVVDPRIAPEAISMCYLHCVLKGLHRAPRISTNWAQGLRRNDVDFMVSPWACWGPPHEACLDAGIPIIAVRENKTAVDNGVRGKVIPVENYWEAAGVIMSMKAGILPESVRRPLNPTKITQKRSGIT